MRELEESLTLTMCLFTNVQRGNNVFIPMLQFCQFRLLGQSIQLSVREFWHLCATVVEEKELACWYLPVFVHLPSQLALVCSNVAMQHACKNNFSNDEENVSMCYYKREDNKFKVNAHGLHKTILHSAIMIHFCTTILQFWYIAKAGAPVNIYVSMFRVIESGGHWAGHATQNARITFLFQIEAGRQWVEDNNYKLHLHEEDRK